MQAEIYILGLAIHQHLTDLCVRYAERLDQVFEGLVRCKLKCKAYVLAVMR